MANVRMLLGFVALCWFASTLSVRADEAAASQVAGDWVYAFADLIEADGKTYKTSVSGGLKLSADGKFEQSRKIGSVVNSGKGKYTLQKDQLVLTYADGSKPDKYTVKFGTHTDAQGTKFKALTLISKSSDGGSFKYLLTKKE